MIFHCDANSFYASCERVFRPDLQHSPIVVLTNNDSIIIALNAEAKKLNLKRGDAFWKIESTLTKHGGVAFSSNYTLYADMSRRITERYMALAPNVEQYSIDECFLYFPDFSPKDCVEIGHIIKADIFKNVGIPISVGIANTKTLAKWCNKYAKNTDGVYCWNPDKQEELLKGTLVGDIWGIGHQKAKLLNSMGIFNAFELKNLPADIAKQKLTITGFNTVQELNGNNIIDRDNRTTKDAVCSSRQFNKPIYDLEQLQEAAREYAALATERMIQQKSFASWVMIFLWAPGNAKNINDTKKHLEAYYCNGFGVSATFTFNTPTYSLQEITKNVLLLLNKIYKSGYGYRKVLVNLGGLTNGAIQTNLFDDTEKIEKQNKLMEAYSYLSGRYGRDALTLGKSKHKEQWQMLRKRLSPFYTTQIKDLPSIK